MNGASALSKRLVGVVAVAMLAAGGCSNSNSDGGTYGSRADSPAVTEAGNRSDAGGDERIAARSGNNNHGAAGNADAGRMRTESSPAGGGQEGMMRHALAVPTGDRRTSTVLVEQLLPQEARLNRPYDYRIRVTNLTDAPLAGVTVRE